MLQRKEWALYGSVAIPRTECKECKEDTFIIEGRTACCGESVAVEKIKKVIRESISVFGRRPPPPAEQKEILEKQGNLCFYCNKFFGTLVFRKNKPLRLKINYDHMIPYSYLQANKNTNFVASCHVCNGIKSDKIFATIEEARGFIEFRRIEKGYNF